MTLPCDPLRLLILADDPLARRGLAALLEGQAGILVVGAGHLQEDLPALQDETRPDILLVDLGWDPLAKVASLSGHTGTGLPVVALLVDPEAIASGLGQETGQVLLSVETGSPADRAELILGDMMVGFDGHPVRRMDDLIPLLSGEAVGKSATIRVLRAGRVEERAIVDGERPARGR